jgi:hypothetical protein
MAVKTKASALGKSAGAGVKNAMGGKSFSPGLGAAAFNVGVDAFFALKEGNSLGAAVAKGIPISLAWTVAPGAMWGMTIASVAGGIVPGYIKADENLRSKYNQLHKTDPHFTFSDTRQAYTMRQAAVQAIQGSKLNARNALGGEAALMHRNRNDRMGV